MMLHWDVVFLPATLDYGKIALLYEADRASSPSPGCFRAGNSGRQIALAGNFGY
jgi:hypothetical protein